MLLISKQRRFIFLHIYKTAGASITKALERFSIDTTKFKTHITASELIAIIGREEFDRHFTFAVVRNPWDWQVSLFCYIRQRKNHHEHDQVAGFSGFGEYIRWRCSAGVKLMKDFIYQADECLVDFVGRFERIDEDFETICQQIGVYGTKLPHCNATKRRGAYQRYYDAKTRKLVGDTFGPDIEAFRYQFEAQ